MNLITTNRPAFKPALRAGAGLQTVIQQAPKAAFSSLKAAPQGQMASMLVHLAAWQYVPSAMLTPITEAQLLKHSGLPAVEQRHQVQKEMTRQATGAGLHFLQCYSSLSFKEGLKKFSQWVQQSQTANKQLAGHLLQPLAKPLARLFATEASETATSLVLLMTFNAIGYGVLRPVITNGMFFGWMGLEDWWQQKHKQPLPNTAPQEDLPNSALATSVLGGSPLLTGSPAPASVSTATVNAALPWSPPVARPAQASSPSFSSFSSLPGRPQTVFQPAS
jgi:hypothetical protein